MNNSIFVAFDPVEDGFRASVSMEQMDALGDQPESLLLKEASTYIPTIRSARDAVIAPG